MNLSAWVSRSAASCFQQLKGGKLSVLIFHRVLERPDPLNPSVPDRGAFESILQRLVRDFNVVSLEAALPPGGLARLPPRAVAITFDDGYADNADVAVPALKKFGLTATFFVATGFLEGGRMWNDTVIEAIRGWPGSTANFSHLGLGVHSCSDVASRAIAIGEIIGRIKYLEPSARLECVNRIADTASFSLPDDLMMTRAQVRSLAEQNMTIGAHTVDHPILAVLNDADAEYQIAQSKAQLEAIVQAPVRLFAYPNGKPDADYSRRDLEIVRRLGFEAAVSTAIGAVTEDSDRFQWPRFTPWRQGRWGFGLQLAQNFLRTRIAVT